MRILFLSTQFPPNLWDGLGQATYQLTTALAARGHEVHVLSCLQSQPSSDEVRDGVHVHRRATVLPARASKRHVPIVDQLFRASKLLWGRNYPDDRVTWRLDQAVSNARHLRGLGLVPDVVWTHESDAHGLVIELRRRVPVVVQLCGPALLRVRLWGRWTTRARIADWLDRFSTRRATTRVAASPFIEEVLRDADWLQAPPPVHIVPAPFNVAGWPADDAATTEPIVLTVGRVEPTKGPDTLVEAAAQLRDKIPGVRFVFVGGDFPSRNGQAFSASVRERNRALGNPVEFVGPVPNGEMAAWYARARVVAVPSPLDMFPNVALEAMAAGRPVVVTEGVGTKSIVEHHDAGSVVPVRDASALAEALATYLTDPQRAAAAGANGRRVVETELSPANVAAQAEKLFEDLLAGG